MIQRSPFLLPRASLKIRLTAEKLLLNIKNEFTYLGPLRAVLPNT